MKDSKLQQKIDSSKHIYTPLMVVDFNVLAWHIIGFLMGLPPRYSSSNDVIKGLWAKALNLGPIGLDPNINYRIVAISDAHFEGTTSYWRGILSRDHNFVYKGDRTEKPTLFYTVYDVGREYCKKYLDFYSFPGFEADDIAGLIRREVNQPDRVKIFYTIDNDWLQLVDDETNFYFYSIRQPKPKEWRQTQAADNALVKQYSELRLKYPISHPSELASIKQIIGDKGDNIPPGMPEFFVSLIHPHPDFDIKKHYDTNGLITSCNSYEPNKQHEHLKKADTALKKFGIVYLQK